MADIYQRIWDADLNGSGLQAIFDDESGDPAVGYVKVNRQAFAPGGSNDGTKVITEVNIPQAKANTYARVLALFNNYALDEKMIEVDTPEEREEVHNFLHAIVDTPPMLVARDYVQEMTGTTVSKERWYTTLLEMWFRSYPDGDRPALSGFEHVIVGEQKDRKVGGYHFWYKYWLDDGLADQIDGGRGRFPGLKDRIVYLRSQSADGQQDFPESVTISYRWDAPDYERKAIRPLTKPTGGFFVGCSIEGLLAMGTVRAHLGARAARQAIINGARYELELHLSASKAHVRTFYPMFKGPAPQGPQPASPEVPAMPPVVGGSVRIVAALVNPVGADPGSETVTLINTGPGPVSLDGWSLLNTQGHKHAFSGILLGGGASQTIVLPRDAFPLSNKGGSIRLLDAQGSVVHNVSYSKAQASSEGLTLVF